MVWFAIYPILNIKFVDILLRGKIKIKLGHCQRG